MTKTKQLPTDKERWALRNRIQREVDKLHGKDDEGHSYAKVEVHDRRDGHWPYIRPVPRIPWENPTPQQMMEAIDAAGGNVESTARDFEQVRRDVQSYFEKNARDMTLAKIAKEVLGDNVCIGQSYSRFDDAPQWHQWRSYKAKGGYRPNELTTAYFNSVNGLDPDKFREWLKAGKRYLLKTFKKIEAWYIKTDGAVGTSLAGLTVIPEKDRPAIAARNRARREFLEEHAKEVEEKAKAIEHDLRTTKPGSRG